MKFKIGKFEITIDDIKIGDKVKIAFKVAYEDENIVADIYVTLGNEQGKFIAITSGAHRKDSFDA